MMYALRKATTKVRSAILKLAAEENCKLHNSAYVYMYVHMF